MKIVSIDFLYAPNIKIEEKATCKDTVVYLRGAKNGKWLAQALSVGKDLKDACMKMVYENKVDCTKVLEWFDKYCRVQKIDVNSLNARKYQNKFDKWLNTCVTGESLFKMICDTEIYAFVDWGAMSNDMTVNLGKSSSLVD